MKRIVLVGSALLMAIALADDGKWGIKVNTNVETKGKEEQKGQAEVFIPIHQQSDRITFVDLRGSLSNSDSNENMSFSFGHRRNINNKFVVGANASYDSAVSSTDNRYGQIAAGVELFTNRTDVKINFYKALDGRNDLEGTSVEPYAVLDGNEIRIVSKKADYEAGMDGADIRLAHRFYLGNDLILTLSGTGYHYKGDGSIQDLNGAEVRAQLQKAFAFFGLDSSVSAFVGADHNSWSGTQFIAGAGLSVKLGKGHRTGSPTSLDHLMDSGVDRKFAPTIGLGIGEWSSVAGTGTLAGYEFSYIDTITAEDDFQGTIDGSSPGTLLVLSGEKGVITITENINLGKDRIMIGYGRPILVHGPNGEKFVLVLPENRATVDGKKANYIVMGSNSTLDGLNTIDAGIHVLDANHVTINDLNMIGGAIKDSYGWNKNTSMIIENSSNVAVTNSSFTSVDGNVYGVDQDGKKVILKHEYFYAIDILDSQNVTISNNDFANAGISSPIGGSNNNNVTISNNQIDSHYGISFANSDEISLIDNDINVATWGVGFFGDDGNYTIAGNKITGNVYIGSGNSAHISNNSIVDGITLGPVSDVIISDNNLNGASIDFRNASGKSIEISNNTNVANIMLENYDKVNISVNKMSGFLSVHNGKKVVVERNMLVKHFSEDEVKYYGSAVPIIEIGNIDDLIFSNNYVDAAVLRDGQKLGLKGPLTYINFTNNQNSVISGNTTDTGGIVMENGKEMVFEGNTVYGHSVVTFSSFENILAKANNIQTLGDSALLFFGNQKIRIEDNSLTTNGMAGIQISNHPSKPGENYIVGNLITMQGGTGRYGIIINSADTTIENNDLVYQSVAGELLPIGVQVWGKSKVAIIDLRTINIDRDYVDHSDK